MHTIPIAKIGNIQKTDIEQTSGVKLYNAYGRICSVYKSKKSRIGDSSPRRIAKLFGGNWQSYNHQFIVQVAGCPLNCWYCYVDNLDGKGKNSKNFTVVELVDLFVQFRSAALDDYKAPINVFHLMGGDPALYCAFWPHLRDELDRRHMSGVIILSNTVLVERKTKRLEPWKFLDIPHFMLSGCLKGVNREDFLKNTGKDLYHAAVSELKNYVHAKNFYLTIVGQSKNLDWPGLYELIPKDRIDFLNIVNYNVVKDRKKE